MPEGFRKRVVPLPSSSSFEVVNEGDHCMTSHEDIEPLGQGGFNFIEDDVTTLEGGLTVDRGEEVTPLLNFNDHCEIPDEVVVPSGSIKSRLRKRKITSIKDSAPADHRSELTPVESIKSRLRNAKVTEVGPQLVTTQFNKFYRDSEEDHPLSVRLSYMNEFLE